MKLIVKIVLVLFLSFITLPTIVGIVDKGADISYFFNTTEEEENISSFNEIKMVYENESILANFFFESSFKKEFVLLDEQLECKFSFTIVLPPPELI